jgi:hypothetical protein
VTYVQYGCAFSAAEGWQNFDASPTLWIERLPGIGDILSAVFSGNNGRFPKSVKFGDIRKGPLVPAGTADGVYASHVLEHLSLDDFRIALVNTHEMLSHGGVFRLIVPDLYERARRYVLDAEINPAAAEAFMRSTYLGKQSRPTGAIGIVRQFLGNSDHLWMWDESSITQELSRAGFTDIRRCDIGDSGIKIFEQVECKGRFYDIDLGIRECAMEARKP